MKEPLDGLSVAAAFLAMSLGPALRASSAHPEHAPLPAALASFLASEVHGSASDRDLLLAGKPVVKLLDADPAREVAVFGAVWSNFLYWQEVCLATASPGSRVAPFAAGCGTRPRTECVRCSLM
jgi:hypothetical protein